MNMDTVLCQREQDGGDDSGEHRLRWTVAIQFQLFSGKKECELLAARSYYFSREAGSQDFLHEILGYFSYTQKILKYH